MKIFLIIFLIFDSSYDQSIGHIMLFDETKVLGYLLAKMESLKKLSF